MGESQNTGLEIVGQFGTLETVALLSAVILLLIWLLVRLLRGKAAEVSTESAERPIVVSKERLRPAPKVPDAEPAPVAPSLNKPQPQVAAAPVVPAVATGIPEDSVLRRHYLSNLEAQRLARSEPYPSDSVLHRHYDAAHTLHLDDAPSGAVAAVTPISPALVATQVTAPPVAIKPAVPQDSVLKRHFLAQLQVEIEAGLAPAPSDSVLARHHRNLVAAELEKRLLVLQG